MTTRRNEACPCGSGKKYKRCHGAANVQSLASRIVTGEPSVAELLQDARQQQSAGIDEINRAVIEIDGMTQQNATLVDAAAMTAAGLHDQAQSLTGSVALFQLGEREFGTAEETLATWQTQLVRPQHDWLRLNAKSTANQNLSAALRYLGPQK